MQSIFGIHEQALHIRRERQDLLANNLANADTPNYKARDLDWKKAMRASESEFNSGGFGEKMEVTDPRHIAGSGDMSTSDFLKYRMPTQPSLDGNTVEPDIEKTQFMENAMQYQATLEFINGKISGIRGAIKGQ